MNLHLLHASIEKEARFTFARSGGPGGQNVNKVNTKVFLSVSIHMLEGVSPEEAALIQNRLVSRIDAEGTLTISVEEERSQYRNREIAIKRIEELLIRAAKPEKKRIPTKPGKAAKLRRLVAKKTRSLIKKDRNTPHREE